MSNIIKPGDRAFYINRKRYAEIESHAKVGVEGFYFGRAIKPGFGVTREFGFKLPNPNLLTDLGMDAFGTGAQFTRMHLGTGTSAPQVTDTSLANFGVNVQVGVGSSESGVSGVSPHYGWRRLTWTSSVGGATGNWTEIGISNQNGNGNLRSRALILDSGGSPTVFPVLADEQFEGTYEFRLYAPEADALESVDMSGSPHDTITRAGRVTSGDTGSAGNWALSTLQGSNPMFRINPGFGTLAYTGALGSITDVGPSGSSLGGASSVSSSAYGAGDHYLDVSARWGSGAGVGAMRSFVLPRDNSGTSQVEYDPVINKLTTEEVIINHRVIWARR